MTSADRADRSAPLPTSRKVLCVGYGIIAVVALIATWSQNLAYFDHPGRFLPDFLHDLTTTPASRSITADLMLFGLAVTILTLIEARKYGVRFVWLYLLGSFATAISVTFPLFLIARELRMGASDAPRLRLSDNILLAVVAVLLVGVTVWTETR